MNLLIRADATTQMGTGHVMRCLALAQTWQETGGTVFIVTANIPSALHKRLTSEGMSVLPIDAAPGSTVDAAQSIEMAHKAGVTWGVIDGYQFDADYQQAIKQAELNLLFIDDYGHTDHYYADVVLNQNIYAHETLYPNREPYTQLLLGTRYALLRREFWPWRNWQRDIPPVARKVLITLGGGDPDNQTLKVVRALEQVELAELEVVAVVGASNPHLHSLQNAATHSRVDIRLVQNVTNMPELMAWADIAISAGGSTCWELAFMGLPNVILILAKNQGRVGAGLDKHGVALNLGWYTDVNELELARKLNQLIYNLANRKAMNKAGQMLVDGYGTKRVVLTMDKAKQSDSLTDRLKIRRAGLQDLELLWQWTNDPVVRANSFRTTAISLEEHIKWYRAVLDSSNTCLWILELDQVPVAQIRYDRINAIMAKISFSVASGYRGKGLGTEILVLTRGLACEEMRVRHLKGIVFDTNQASKQIFIKAGFSCVNQEQINGKNCHIFIWKCA